MPYNYKTELERYRRYYQSLEPILSTQKNQTYTTIIFSFLTVSLFGWYAIRPTIQTILFLKREIKDKTELSKKMEEKITGLILAQAAYEQLESFIPNLDDALPPNPEAIPLVLQLRNLANESDAMLSGVQLPTTPLLARDASKSADKSNAQQVFDFTLSIQGDYSSIQRFLEGLRAMRRILTIESVSVQPMRETRSSSSDSAQISSRQLQLTMRLKSYYLIGK